MSANSLKKMLIFSSERIKKIIENMIKEESEIKNTSFSSMTETHLLNELLPQNRNAARWVEFMYDGTWNIENVLEASFSYLAAGTLFQARYDNAAPLVHLAHQWNSMTDDTPDAEAGEMYHFMSQLDTIVELLNYAANEATEFKFELSREAKKAKELYDLFRNNSDKVKFSHVYMLIIDNWEVLKNSTFTYRLLTDMVAMKKNWLRNEEARYELTQTLKKVSAEWEN